MSEKEQINAIIDTLPSKAIISLLDYAQYLAEKNEEYLSDDEIKSLNIAIEDMNNGVYYSLDDI